MILLAMAIALQPFPESGPLTAPRREAIMRAVGDRLRDGPSARWRWPQMRNGGGYCGFVNSKNAFGAYIGFQPFYVIGGDFGEGYRIIDIVLDEEGREGFPTRRTAREMCVLDGYDVETLPAE